MESTGLNDRIEDNLQEGNPAYPHIDREPNRYEYETSVEIEGEQEPIHGGKIKKQSTD
jgi:hypothetical protein